MDEQSENERRKYDAVWRDPRYLAPDGHAEMVALRGLRELVHVHGPEMGLPGHRTLIDFGCGSGNILNFLADTGARVLGVDISDARAGSYRAPFVQASLWELPPMRAEFGFCCDVMEHMPTDRVVDVLRGIKQSCSVACFFQIAMFPDHFGPLLLGEPLHLTVQEPGWWFEQFRLAGWAAISGKVEDAGYLNLVASRHRQSKV